MLFKKTICKCKFQGVQVKDFSSTFQASYKPDNEQWVYVLHASLLGINTDNTKL